MHANNVYCYNYYLAVLRPIKIKMTTKNPVNELNIPRRKKRDLETTMNTLKQLLEPTLVSKTGSRKKNKPRSLAKKVIPPKKVIPFESCSDGEYYPNKMKRKVRLKKTILKPKHDLKVILATNKRKRRTPHRGLESIYDETIMDRLIPLDIESIQAQSNLPDNTIVPTVPSKTIDAENVTHKDAKSDIKSKQTIDTKTLAQKDTTSVSFDIKTKPMRAFKCLSIDTQSLNADIHSNNDFNHTSNKYELISPPHRSLTEMTVDDLIRMDEDSLSDENLMEILTCPSPVWWENPNECRGSLFFALKAQTSTNTINDVEQTTNIQNKVISEKKTDTASKKNTKKAKLETVLGNIKSRVQTDTITNNSNDDSILKENSNDTDDANIPKENAKVNETPAFKSDTKRRKISSSGSEISVNEDTLTNLASINIPVQEDNLDKNTDKDSGKDLDDKTIDIANDDDVSIIVKDTPIFDEEMEPEGNECDDSSDKLYVTEKRPELYRKKYRNKNKETNKCDSNESTVPEDKDKTDSILKRLKNINDDILDVRLIQVPTNVTNEVKVWSKLDNFKRHNFKPEDFITEVIDIEDELEFSMIETNQSEDQKSKSETILIDDDSNDGSDNRTLNINDTISMDDIEQCSTFTAILENDTARETYDVINYSDIKEVTIDNNIEKDPLLDELAVIINTADIILEDSIPKRKPKNAGKEERKKNAKIKKKLSKITILPMKAVLPAENVHTPAEISYQYIDKNYARRSLNKNKDLLDVTDTADAILCLDGVDVSLVKNPVPDVVKISENQAKDNDLSITLINTNPKDITGSPKSDKSTTSGSNIDYSEDTISVSNIQFLDEYEDNKTNKEEESQITSEELDIEVRKDVIIIKHANQNEATNSDQNVENTLTDMMELDGSQTYEIRYSDEHTQIDENVNKGNLNERMNEQDHEQIQEEEDANNEIEQNMEEKSDDNEIKNSDTNDLDQNKMQDELVTIYQIVSNSDIDSMAVKEFEDSTEE